MMDHIVTAPEYRGHRAQCVECRWVGSTLPRELMPEVCPDCGEAVIYFSLSGTFMKTPDIFRRIRRSPLSPENWELRRRAQAWINSHSVELRFCGLCDIETTHTAYQVPVYKPPLDTFKSFRLVRALRCCVCGTKMKRGE